ncbi:MAG: hypothetical protein ACR2GX_02215 [Candidatus Dormibacteria bacterium]
MNPKPPEWSQVVLGITVVMLGCLGACWSLWMMQKSRNWLLLIMFAGFIVFTVGVVGQQPAPASGNAGSVWQSSISIPLLGAGINPIAIVGLLLGLVGLSLVLFLEQVVPEERRWRPPPWRPLDEDDAV